MGGSAPPGIKRVLQAPTQFALALYRTQLFGPEDSAALWKIQDQFRVQTLAQYTGAPAPAAAATPEWCPPLDVRKDPTSLRFFAVLNWMLQYMPPLDDERELRATFSAIGVEAAPDFAEPEPEQRTALLQGMQAGQGAMVDHLRTVKSSGELFGSREFLGHNYLSRAVGAMVGILGNSAAEYLGIGYPGDANGQPFDGSHCYQIKFTPAAMPPVKAFWSITVYDAHMLFYANPLQRYVVNSALAEQLVQRCRRRLHPVRAARLAWIGQGGKLAARTCRKVQPHIPCLSAGAGDP